MHLDTEKVHKKNQLFVFFIDHKCRIHT